MLTRVQSAAVLGVDAFLVEVEVDLARGLPSFATVGLAEGAVKESRVRVESALKNCGVEFPQRRITVNLAPADVRKAGTAFDLPMAVGLVAASQSLPQELLQKTLIVGEMGLDGEVRKIPGAMSIAVMARERGLKYLICPAESAPEAGVVGGITVLPVEKFQQVVDHLAGRACIEPIRSDPSKALTKSKGHRVDFSDVKGQEHAKRALEVAAAGGHNLIMIGPPGSGKTMLARRLPTILPALSFEEAIETTKVYSIMGLTPHGAALIAQRPFRSPHHTVSDAGLIGGGTIPRPGEVSLAHNGVLFLDELPEFRRNVLEVLRQPLEDSVVTIARAQMSVSFPAKIMLVAAMNPCPCGHLSSPTHVCLCSPQAIQRYRSRVSGPLLDRIDIQVEVPAVAYKDIMSRCIPESSHRIRTRVDQAREIQKRRFAPIQAVRCNAQMPASVVRDACRLGQPEQDLLELAVKRLGLSARAIERVMKVSRTIADLEQKDRITSRHVAEAIQYRSLDRVLGGGV